MLTMVFELVIKNWITWMTTLLTGAIVALWKKVSQNRKAQEKESRAMKEAIVSLMRDRILQSCRYYLEKKKITTSELQVLTELNDTYHALGGDGIVTELVKAVNDRNAVELVVERFC